MFMREKAGLRDALGRYLAQLINEQHAQSGITGPDHDHWKNTGGTKREILDDDDWWTRRVRGREYQLIETEQWPCGCSRFARVLPDGSPGGPQPPRGCRS